MFIYVKMERAEIKIRLFTSFQLALNALPPYILYNHRELGNNALKLSTFVLLPNNLRKTSK